MQKPFRLICKNHEDNGGDDKGQLIIDVEDEVIFVTVSDEDAASGNVAAGLYLTRFDAREMRDYLNEFLETRIEIESEGLITLVAIHDKLD